MPELPEVETIVRTLAPFVENHTILHAPPHLPLQHRLILSLTRAGKFLLFTLDHGFLAIHLRMTGKLLWNTPAGPYTRATFILDNGTLTFDDVRRFGRITFSPTLPANVAALAPDPFQLTPAVFASILRPRRTALKPLLLNQSLLAGLGNIYVDEALHRARLHPLAPANSLSPATARRLHAAILQTLTEAIAAGGSSISDYVDAQGRPGTFQLLHRVYARAGQPCPVCRTPVVRITVAQRGTHLCPRCQRLPSSPRTRLSTMTK
ncbi:MAG: bifunctional DNA-formamidopyrimidine glycosylase/DNA-(apurinic or apyrimidinic site) lyase [Bryobacterales bacterium]|nr:bifunctional DNA-formamidopyrimidine glycosylase/DNA-(apurinic or apyrimidinic site) lyase [Bryobacterales bacterium]